MRRLRLKADGRIVEVVDGRETPVSEPHVPSVTARDLSQDLSHGLPQDMTPEAIPAVRELRMRAKLTQAEFATKLCVPIETIRNWEQGKRSPRGPARALLAVIAHAPDMVFAALAGQSRG